MRVVRSSVGFFFLAWLLMIVSLIEANSAAAAAHVDHVSFPLIYKWSKRNHEKAKGCTDPTEPFQCPGTNTCISLQFICDGHPGDCPNDYDENQGLCISGKERKREKKKEKAFSFRSHNLFSSNKS
jgi:hypothetical protein